MVKCLEKGEACVRVPRSFSDLDGSVFRNSKCLLKAIVKFTPKVEGKPSIPGMPLMLLENCVFPMMSSL